MYFLENGTIYNALVLARESFLEETTSELTFKMVTTRLTGRQVRRIEDIPGSGPPMCKGKKHKTL